MPSQMSWSEPGPSCGYGQAYGDSGFNAEIPQPLGRGMSAMVLWDMDRMWKHGKPKHLDLSNSSVIPIKVSLYGKIVVLASISVRSIDFNSVRWPG